MSFSEEELTTLAADIINDSSTSKPGLFRHQCLHELLRAPLTEQRRLAFEEKRRVRTTTISQLREETKQHGNFQINMPPKLPTIVSNISQPSINRVRTGTISQLREETKQHNKINIGYNISQQPSINQVPPPPPLTSSHDTINDDEWKKYLMSIFGDLSQKVQYFQLIGKKIPSVWTVSNTDVHIMERTLMQQMKFWIEMYGIPGMVAHENVYKLKKDLIVAIEEADTLEEESIQFEQKCFEMENQVQILKNEQQKCYQKINELNDNIYKMKQKYEHKNGYNVSQRSSINQVPPPPPLTSSMINKSIQKVNM